MWTSFTNGVDCFTIATTCVEFLFQNTCAATPSLAAIETATDHSANALFCDMDSDNLRQLLDALRYATPLHDCSQQHDMTRFQTVPHQRFDVCVGGRWFASTRDTLQQLPYFESQSRFQASSGNDFVQNIDCDDAAFAAILSHLRNPVQHPRWSLLHSAPHGCAFFGLIAEPLTALDDSHLPALCARFASNFDCAQMPTMFHCVSPLPIVFANAWDYYAEFFCDFPHLHQPRDCALSPATSTDNELTFDLEPCKRNGHLLHTLCVCLYSNRPLQFVVEFFDAVSFEVVDQNGVCITRPHGWTLWPTRRRRWRAFRAACSATATCLQRWCRFDSFFAKTQSAHC